ncbi:MAG: helix-turn-helix transcriptional regulator, partial [Pirellulales bacterium]
STDVEKLAAISDTSVPGEPRSADQTLIDLLRVGGDLGIGALATGLGVTATAVRQRLERLMRTGLVQRQAVAGKRGRPAHVYSLTPAGKRVGGDNFQDLALVLWREIRGVKEPAIRRGLLGRIGTALAGMHRQTMVGDTPVARMHGVADMMRSRNIACAVETAPSGDNAAAMPVLTSYSCPYPDLAEEDRGICAAERTMIEELVGSPVQLSECRLDGGSCCRFSMRQSPVGNEPPTVPADHLQTSG